MTNSADDYSEAQVVLRASAGSQARRQLPLKAVRIELLDQESRPVLVNGPAKGPVVASGFLMRESAGACFLYTCWHVVTGIDPQHPALPAFSQRRAKLRFRMQQARQGTAESDANEDFCTVTLPLYDDAAIPWIPLWEQDSESRQNENLLNVGLSLPYWRDIVRLQIESAIDPSVQQLLTPVDVWPELVDPGENLMIVGYPYGYSALKKSPSAIAITRSVASTRLESERPMDILIDGSAAPGMSGGPVFYIHENRIYLYGVYTGVVYPDGPSQNPERTTALGTVCSLGTALPFAKPIASKQEVKAVS